MRIGICHLCRKTSELCNSHALPDSLFNYILRASNGKAIAITDDQTSVIQYSTDTWDTELLCKTCEAKLNRNYDSYGIGVFRGRIAMSRRVEVGVTFTGIDRQHLRMFFLSVLWRISISSHQSYGNIDLPYQWEDELHDAFLNEQKIPSSRFTVAIYRLRDSTAVGFSSDSLREFVMAPFARQYKGFISVCYLFFGFFIEIFLPRLPKRFSGQPGILSGTGSIFMAPYREILDVPEIMNLLVRGLVKHESGLTQVS